MQRCESRRKGHVASRWATFLVVLICTRRCQERLERGLHGSLITRWGSAGVLQRVVGAASTSLVIAGGVHVARLGPVRCGCVAGLVAGMCVVGFVACSSTGVRAAGRGPCDRGRVVVGIGLAGGRGRTGDRSPTLVDRARGIAELSGFSLVHVRRTERAFAERVLWGMLGHGWRLFGAQRGLVSCQIGGRDLAVGNRIVERIAERQTADRPRRSLARVEPLPAIATLRSHVLDRLSAVGAGLHAANISTAYMRRCRA